MKTFKRFVRNFLELLVINSVIVVPFANMLMPLLMPLLVVCIAIPLLSIIGAWWITTEMNKWDRQDARREGYKTM